MSCLPYLDIVALMVVTTLAEQPMVNNAVDVQLVQKRISVLRNVSMLQQKRCKRGTNLGNRCSEDNNFVQFTHSLHELIDTWPLDNVNIMILTLDLHRDREVCLMQDL